MLTLLRLPLSAACASLRHFFGASARRGGSLSFWAAFFVRKETPHERRKRRRFAFVFFAAVDF
jgi:hypothetical protein